MIKRRAIAAATATCWAGATTGILFNWPPGEKTHSYLLAAGVALVVWLRTSTDTREDMPRRLATMFYQMGVVHGLKNQDVAQDATVHRLSNRRTGTGRGGGGAAATVLFAGVALVALLAATSIADAMERASAPEAGPSRVHSTPEDSPATKVTTTPKWFRAGPIAGHGEPARTLPDRPASPRTSTPGPSRSDQPAETSPAGPAPAGTATTSKNPGSPLPSQTPAVVDSPDLLVTTTAQ
jgi:hypothetical protein